MSDTITLEGYPELVSPSGDEFAHVSISGVNYKIKLSNLGVTGGGGGGTLATPGSFTVTPGDTQNVLDWANVTDATSYTVDRATNSGFTTGVTLNIYSGATSAYTDTGRTNGTTYYYRVYATASGFTNSGYATGNGTPASGGSYDTDATTFFTAAEAYTTLTGTEKTAWDNFVTGSKSDGVYGDYIAAYPYLGGVANSCKLNAIVPVDDDASYRISWVNSPTFDANGVDFNGTNQYGNTHINIATIGLTAGFMLGFYGREDVGTEYTMGDYAGGNDGLYIAPDADGNGYVMAASTYKSFSGVSSTRFHLGGCEPGGTPIRYYRDGTSLLNVSGEMNTPTNTSIYIGAVKDSTVLFSSLKLGLSIVTKGVNSTKAALIKNRVNTLMAALSRNV